MQIRVFENLAENKKGGISCMSRTIPQWIKDAKPRYCAACGKETDLQYHHLVPVLLGGKTEPNNIIVLCGVCHQRWHDQRGAEKHNNLVKVGIAKAKESGVKVGRKPADQEKIMRLIAENSTQFNADSLTTENEIMEMAGVKPSCYHKCKRALLSAMERDTWPYEWEKPERIRNVPLYDAQIKRLRGDAIA